MLHPSIPSSYDGHNLTASSAVSISLASVIASPKQLDDSAKSSMSQPTVRMNKTL